MAASVRGGVEAAQHADGRADGQCPHRVERTGVVQRGDHQVAALAHEAVGGSGIEELGPASRGGGTRWAGARWPSGVPVVPEVNSRLGRSAGRRAGDRPGPRPASSSQSGSSQASTSHVADLRGGARGPAPRCPAPAMTSATSATPQQVGDLGRRQVAVDRHHRRARAQPAEVGDDRLGGVLGEHGHPPARRRRCGARRGGRCGRPIPHLLGRPGPAGSRTRAASGSGVARSVTRASPVP